MKLKNILYTGVALLSLSACGEYLDVEAPSSYTEEFVYGHKSEIERALNGVYAQALVNDLYGNAYQRTFILNSDVEMTISSSGSHSSSSYTRFDCDDQGGEINKFWSAAYTLIEYANRFITSAESSSIYDKSDADIMQWIGEAKCLRAMAYHDLVVMFGDVPFTMSPSSTLDGNYNIPVEDRQVIQDAIIADLMEAEQYMQSSSAVTVEHCSKEFAQAMIARIALTAGGYSLRPDKANPTSYGTMQRPANYKDYYSTVVEYAGAIIAAQTHNLGDSYRDVFVKECNYEVATKGDPIFEIPFARESTGNTGYIQGPTYSEYEGKTVGPWGKCDGGARLNAFYRFLFRENDTRREYVNGLWYYTYQTKPDGSMVDSVCIRNDYTVHNNKWSKLWTNESSALGADKSGSTGINYPYMRYADVLLMYAEAANELHDGPTTAAIEKLKMVHDRAFPYGDHDLAFINEAKVSKEAFQKAVLKERMWEFAGENSRWRDLVRTNTYSEELVYSFLRYYSAAMQNCGSMTYYEDAINEHDGAVYIDNLPTRIYFHPWNISETLTTATLTDKNKNSKRYMFYGYTVVGENTSSAFDQKYPNAKLPSLRIWNPYKSDAGPVAGTKATITNFGFAATGWSQADFYQWGNTDTGKPKPQCMYSFYGYIRCDESGNINLIDNGVQKALPLTLDGLDASNLPVVRYILPYPNAAIQRSNGTYKNYYGY